MLAIKYINTIPDQKHTCMLYNKLEDLKSLALSVQEQTYIKTCTSDNKEVIAVNQYSRWLFFIKKPASNEVAVKAEKLRRLGCQVQQQIQNLGITELYVENNTPSTLNILDFIEGIVLSNYQFLKYKTEPKPNTLRKLFVCDLSLQKQTLLEAEQLYQSVYIARNLVNEPLSTLTAVAFSEQIERIGKESGYNVEVLNKSKIQSLKMGGLLAVNAGSLNPPTFTILEYKPKKSVNKQPIVLVGKGVVYDTGGYSLKPADSLDWMKCDMAGAAAVVGSMRALAANKVPVYTIGLIPATENKLDGHAIVPGDVITMYNQKTVEVVNTDAEGRLILADALAYAAKYNPMLVIDLATLTGSAMRALGKEGIVYMGTANTTIKQQVEQCGAMVHERLVEFPLWEEYDEQLKSDIADYKNLGNGPEAGAIMGGKFLQQFTSYPWLHLDIATMAYLKASDTYRSKNGTGVGVRLLYKYLTSLVK